MATLQRHGTGYFYFLVQHPKERNSKAAERVMMSSISFIQTNDILSQLLKMDVGGKTPQYNFLQALPSSAL